MTLMAQATVLVALCWSTVILAQQEASPSQLSPGDAKASHRSARTYGSPTAAPPVGPYQSSQQSGSGGWGEVTRGYPYDAMKRYRMGDAPREPAAREQDSYGPESRGHVYSPPAGIQHDRSYGRPNSPSDQAGANGNHGYQGYAH